MNNLRCLRKAKGMSQTELATRLGVCQQAVGKWERGESDPKWAMAPVLAQVLGCSIAALFQAPAPRKEAG